MKNNKQETVLVKNTDGIITLSSDKQETIHVNSHSSQELKIHNFDAGIDKIDLSQFGKLGLWINDCPEFIKQPNSSLAITNDNETFFESGRRRLTLSDKDGKKFEILIKLSDASNSPDWALNLSTGKTLRDRELFDNPSLLTYDNTERKVDGTGHGNLKCEGGFGNNILKGGAGNDILSTVNSGGNNILHGGAGDDLLYGGEGNDVYQFGRGDGRDTVYSLFNYSSRNPKAGHDTLQLGEGITADDIKLQKEDNELVVIITDTNDSIRFYNYYSGSGASNYSRRSGPIEKIEFADGSVIDKAGIDQLVEISAVSSNFDKSGIKNIHNSMGVPSNSDSVGVKQLIDAMAMFSNEPGASSQINNNSPANVSGTVTGYSYNGDLALSYSQ